MSTTAAVPTADLVVFFIIAFFIVYLVKHMKNVSTTTTSTTNSSSATDTSTNQVDAVNRMTPEERKEYVNNFLKTMKYVGKEGDVNASNNLRRLSSFRIAKSSSGKLCCPITNTDNKDTDCIENECSIDLEFGQSNTNGATGSCAICLEEFVHNEDICVSQDQRCVHVFHLQCIYPWLLKSQDCPCCRRDYLNVDTETVSSNNSV